MEIATATSAQAALLMRTWSPPISPDLDDVPVIATDDRGMITDTTQSPSPAKKDDLKPAKRKRRTLQYVSRHFSQPQMAVKDEQGERKRKRRKVDNNKEDKHASKSDRETAENDPTVECNPAKEGAQVVAGTTNGNRRKRKAHVVADAEKPIEANEVQSNQGITQESVLAPWQQVLAAPAEQQQKTFSRIFYGLNVDELSSDSDLTDVPDDIGPDPFSRPPAAKSQRKKRTSLRKVKLEDAELVAVKEETPKAKSKPKNGLTKSPYFPHPHKPRPHFLSTLPFPPLHLERFGLMQERLCHDPFRLLLATIFLNKTPGSRAMPIFFKLMEKYPTPEALSKAEQSDVTDIIRELGFQNQRARKCIAMAKGWVEDPPIKGRRRRKPDYPKKGNGKDIKADEVVDDADERVGWEISHLPGLGPYSHDSWRMFCRDELRSLASAYNGEDAEAEGDLPFEPEWKRVLPMDKELRAWMTWMWMKEGWIWNKETGERTKASDELMELAKGKGNVVLESDNSTLLVKSLHEDQPSPMKLSSPEKKDVRVEAPAGDFMPGSAKRASG
ncbi:hypothetical protein PMZ80_004556 [Knufia obscura]|uniref:HhH-GPD domain-containing protein n=2 Tax=Knufia TaxID=430999 RepID=A0AAN8EBL9_9EURO|nr:hypothetical protein PMZ80_004556 [Knufia obscura]KAK5951564.1 hypothetical protein OHC33_007242 [Knufia fluminis]